MAGDLDAPAAVPAALVELMGGRDTAPLPDGALVRYQSIGLTPAIGANFRLVLHADGRLFAVGNEGGAPSESGQRFDTALPDTPVATVPSEVVAEVEALLHDSTFVESAGYEGGEAVRGGAVRIVTARIDGRVHEVWYRNTSTPLTDRLGALYQDAAADEPSLDDLFATFAEGQAEDDS